MAEKVTALAVRAQESAITTEQDPYAPTNISTAMQLSEMFFKSGLVPNAQSPNQVLYLLATGHDLGMSPTMSLRGLFTFQGRVGMYADTMVALVLKSGKCDYWTVVESTPQRCTIETRRTGSPKPQSMTWTIEMAGQAGYSNKNPNWRAIPATMLQHRCAAFLARQCYPDIILGLYDRDELADSIKSERSQPQVIEAQPLPPEAQAAAARVAADAARQAPSPVQPPSPAVNDTRPAHDEQTGEVIDPPAPAAEEGEPPPWVGDLESATTLRELGAAANRLMREQGIPKSQVQPYYEATAKRIRGAK